MAGEGEVTGYDPHGYHLLAFAFGCATLLLLAALGLALGRAAHLW